MTGCSNQVKACYLQEFIVDPGNDLAYRIADSLARSLASEYNPVVFYGPQQSGKSHLMKGIAKEITQRYPEVNILYTPAEEFHHAYRQSLRQKHYQGFREVYRSCDILFLDDLHLLENKIKTQQELMFTIASLHQKCRPVVLSSRVHIKEAPLRADLIAKLTNGLAIKVCPLSRERIIEYTLQLARLHKIVTEQQAVAAICNSFPGHFGDFKKMIHKLFVIFAARKFALTMSVAEKLLQAQIKVSRQITIEQILQEVAAYYRLPSPLVLQQRKTGHKLARPRYVAIFLAKKLLAAGNKQLQENFGAGSESAIRYALSKVEKDENLQKVATILYRQLDTSDREATDSLAFFKICQPNI